jgi:hypothetical protein
MNHDFKITVPVPCDANWNTMTPAEQGRFCGLCDKTVVDFSAMSTPQIKQYFVQHANEKTCGRFCKTQLSTSYNKFQNKLLNIYDTVYNWHKYTLLRTAALAVLSVMLTLAGCNNEEITGKALKEDTLTLAIDTLNDDNQVVEGAPPAWSPVLDSFTKGEVKAEPIKSTQNKNEIIVQGDVEVKEEHLTVGQVLLTVPTNDSIKTEEMN